MRRRHRSIAQGRLPPSRNLLADEGWQVLDGPTDGDPQGNAWCEFGNIDHEGHDRGWKLAKHLEAILGRDRGPDRAACLLLVGNRFAWSPTTAGCSCPAGCPRRICHHAFTENKWGRCAALKPGASTDERLFPWFWNPHQEFALADGISCYRAGDGIRPRRLEPAGMPDAWI